METSQFYSKSHRINSPLRVFGIVKLLSGVLILVYVLLLSGSVSKLMDALAVNNDIMITESLIYVLQTIILLISGLSFLLSGIKHMKKITITPEIPPAFKNYQTIYENLLKGKLDIYKFPDFGPLKFAYNYINDKIPYLTPPKRSVVTMNVSFLKKYIFLLVIILVAFFVQNYFPQGLFIEAGIDPISIKIPIVFLFLLFALMAIGFYTILMIIPENIPRQVVSENFATINGGGDPNSICPAIDKTFNEFRFDKLPNYSYKSGFAKIEDLSFNESGSYDGNYALETHPRYLDRNEKETIPTIYLILAVLSLIISLIYFGTINLTELRFSSIQSALGHFLAGAIFLGTSRNFFRRAFILYNTYQFESVFAYFDITGSIGKSEITAGKAITDSIETKNIVIRSDSQFKIYTTRLLSESYDLNGNRNITAMNIDNNIEEITQRLLQTISNFKEEGVTVRGIDVTAESINQITQANLMIHEARKSTKSLPVSQEQRILSEQNNSGPNETLNLDASDTKECPRCAETIKAKAKMCRYCNYEFE